MLNDNNLFKYIIFNFNLIGKLSNKNKEKFFSFFLKQNIHQKIIDNFDFSNILINMSSYNNITLVMREFLKNIIFFFK